MAPCCDAALLDLQEAAGVLLTASLSAAAYCQAALLTPAHLAPDSFAHKVGVWWVVVGVARVFVCRMRIARAVRITNFGVALHMPTQLTHPWPTNHHQLLAAHNMHIHTHNTPSGDK